ncbi:MAG TPA: OB-fold nucleic acid binding domain-containing protein, partial [Neobacillus sp.]
MGKGILQYDVGEQVELFLLIKSATKGIASNGKAFLTLILQDQSGDIEAKLWDANEEDEKSYAPQNIVKILGDVQNYRGKSQLKIRQIRQSGPSDGVKLDDFLATAPLSIEEMTGKLTQYIFEMKNPNIQRITRHLIKKHNKSFLEYPAATK